MSQVRFENIMFGCFVFILFYLGTCFKMGVFPKSFLSRGMYIPVLLSIFSRSITCVTAGFHSHFGIPMTLPKYERLIDLYQPESNSLGIYCNYSNPMLFGRRSNRSDGEKSSGKAVKKSDLPTKVCVVCERPFSWRKKWERCWDEVQCCSKTCNAKRRSGPR